MIPSIHSNQFRIIKPESPIYHPNLASPFDDAPVSDRLPKLAPIAELQANLRPNLCVNPSARHAPGQAVSQNLPKNSPNEALPMPLRKKLFSTI
jgi:hypothetical protein